jgi:hypothetical protein
MRSAFVAAVSAAALIFSTAIPSAQSNMAKPEKFTAFAVDISNTAPRANATVVDIRINRWSTDTERDQLMKVFREKGQEALLSALQKLPAFARRGRSTTTSTSRGSVPTRKADG